MPPESKTPSARPGDHRLLTRLTPAEERALRRAYPEVGDKPPAIKSKRQRETN